MNKNEDEKKLILADLITRDNSHNGYYEKLGILKVINGAQNNSNVSVLNNLREKINKIDELVNSYKSNGNDLDDRVAFEELQIKVSSVFKLKFNFLYIVILILIILAIIIF